MNVKDELDKARDKEIQDMKTQLQRVNNASNHTTNLSERLENRIYELEMWQDKVATGSADLAVLAHQVMDTMDRELLAFRKMASKCQKGKISGEAFNELWSDFGLYFDEDHWIYDMYVEDQTIYLTFGFLAKSQDETVEYIRPMDHFVNYARKPSLMTNTGPRWVLMNEKLNCTKSIRNPGVQNYLSGDCNLENFFDPSLNNWTESASNYEIIHTPWYDVAYCLYGNITSKYDGEPSETLPCPPYSKIIQQAIHYTMSVSTK